MLSYHNFSHKKKYKNQPPRNLANLQRFIFSQFQKVSDALVIIFPFFLLFPQAMEIHFKISRKLLSCKRLEPLTRRRLMQRNVCTS